MTTESTTKALDVFSGIVSGTTTTTISVPFLRSISETSRLISASVSGVRILTISVTHPPLICLGLGTFSIGIAIAVGIPKEKIARVDKILAL
jgi:hypothetical protein